MADKGEAEYIEKVEKQRQTQLRSAAEKGDWAAFQKELNAGRARLTEEWIPLENKKRTALEAASLKSRAESEILRELSKRQAHLFPSEGWQRQAELTSPLLTGSGNPHPVENGFAFLSPYGVPYLAGSGIKGVMRRAAEELALLCEDSSGWTLPLVWALFGFDEKSAYFHKEGSSLWHEAYDQWIAQVSTKNDALLEALMQLWLDPDQRTSQGEFLRRLKNDVQARRNIHYQGLLAFEDAFPDSDANLGVDILNPHHRTYYQGDGQETPHDADQPVPVFFLVILPGAKFVLRARPLPGRRELWNLVGNWQDLLDAAFEYASQWLGFGAKTSVGYGALEPDREAEKEALQRKREEAERDARLKEEEEKRKREEARRRAEEEAERRRREAEEAAFDALPKSEQIRVRVEQAVERYLSLPEIQRKNGRGDLNRMMKEAIEVAKQIEEPAERKVVAELLEAAYEKVGWADPGLKKKKKEKQELKRREEIAAIRVGMKV
jgi:CRISPR-associated protein Cmr6